MAPVRTFLCSTSSRARTKPATERSLPVLNGPVLALPCGHAAAPCTRSTKRAASTRPKRLRGELSVGPTQAGQPAVHVQPKMRVTSLLDQRPGPKVDVLRQAHASGLNVRTGRASGCGAPHARGAHRGRPALGGRESGPPRRRRRRRRFQAPRRPKSMPDLWGHTSRRALPRQRSACPKPLRASTTCALGAPRESTNASDKDSQ